MRSTPTWHSIEVAGGIASSGRCPANLREAADKGWGRSRFVAYRDIAEENLDDSVAQLGIHAPAETQPAG